MLLPSFAAIQVCFLERLLQNSAISKLGNNFSASFDARNQFAHGKLYIGSLNSSKSCKLAPTCLGRCKHIKHFKSYKNIGFFDSALYGTTMELFSRKRWTTGSAQQSNMYGMLPYMCSIIILVCHKHLGPYCPYLFLLKSSMAKLKCFIVLLFFDLLICN